jgi:hypothetical protein
MIHPTSANATPPTTYQMTLLLSLDLDGSSRGRDGGHSVWHWARLSWTAVRGGQGHGQQHAHERSPGPLHDYPPPRPFP